MGNTSPTNGAMNPAKSLLTNEYLIAVARIVLGLIFLVACIEKIDNPAAFAASILQYKIFSQSLSTIVASFLPWVELICALCLLFGVAVRGSALLVLLMLIVFTLGAVSALARGLDISCGCFTQDPSAETMGWSKIGENLLFILLSVLVLLSDGKKFSLQFYYRAHLLLVTFSFIMWRSLVLHHAPAATPPALPDRTVEPTEITIRT